MYQALYRKWRPRTFDDVVGQQHITETLKRQVEAGRLSHAYLFVGTRGTGKTTCAKILSRAVNCEHPVNGNPCNACPSCLGIESGAVLDVEELDAASNNGVDNIRALRDEAVYSPASVRKRVYIVDEVHMLSTSAFNALLKILEEPPEHLIFILATTELHKVPATILSRCQRFSFKRILPEDIMGRLQYVAKQENIQLTEEGAALLARIADGAMRDALSLLDQCGGDGVVDEERVLSSLGLAGNRETLQLFRAICDGKTPEALQIIDKLHKNGKDMNAVLDELMSLVRDLLLLKLAGKNSAGLLSGYYSRAELAPFAKAVTPQKGLLWLERLKSARADTATAVTARLGAELCIIRMCDATMADDTAALSARIAELENKLAGGDFTFAAAKSAEPREEAPREQPPVDAVSAEEPGLPDEEPPWETEESVPWQEDEPPFAPAPGPAAVPQERKPEPERKPAAPEKKKKPAVSTRSSAPVKTNGNGVMTKVLALVKDSLDPGLYYGINNKTTRGQIVGGRFAIHFENPFMTMMAKEARSLNVLQEAVRQVLGYEINVYISEQELPPEEETVPAGETYDPQEKEPAGGTAAEDTVPPEPVMPRNDKLDALSQFDIVKFE